MYQDRPTKNTTEWIKDLTDNSLVPQISEEEKVMLCEPVTKQELKEALLTFPNNKSPGLDGLSYEFYKYFWDDISDFLLDSLNEALMHGELSQSQRQNLIRLIPKKGKDRLHLKNWRPLYLGESDTKICAKVYALRLAKTLPTVIHHNQIAYVSGRFIGEGIKTIEGIIEYTKQMGLEGYLLSIDFEKAFDSVDWQFLWKTLKAFGYPEGFIDKIIIFYKGIQTKVINGGTTTDFFNMCRGVMQGFPPAGFLFVLAIEMLLIKIRADNNIKGIAIRGHEVKLSGFADDITNFLADLASIERLLQELERFGQASGLRCNIGKCKLMSISGEQANTFTYENESIDWVDEMTVTGITFTRDPKSNITLNYNETMDIMKGKLQVWQSRGLSLLGKTQILKSLGISQLQFVLNMIEPTDNILKQTTSEYTKFLWGSETNKVKNSTIIAQYERGGLKMPDINTTLLTQRIKWVQRFLNDNEHSWKHICNWQLEQVGGATIFENTSINIDAIKGFKMMEFYKSMVISWAQFYTKEITKENVLKQSLFLNNNFSKPDGKAIFYRKLIDKEVMTVSDLVENNRVLDVETISERLSLNSIEKMQMLSTLNTIQREIKNLISEAENDGYLQYARDFIRGRVAKDISDRLIDKKIERPSSENYFETNFNIASEDWDKIYILPFCSTVENKLRAFQFKISHNIFYHNRKLFDKNMIDDYKCTFCGEEDETLTHLFSDCIHVKPLWAEIDRRMQISVYDYENLALENKLFGFYKKISNQNYMIWSQITMLVKYYIHVCRINTKLPYVGVLIKRIEYVENLEFKIAENNNKLMKHYKKWEPYLITS